MSWISVKDRLPPSMKDVLVHIFDKEKLASGIHIGYFVGKFRGWEVLFFDWPDDAEVTHWQELPNVPDMKGYKLE